MLAGQSANTPLEAATARVAFLPAVGQTHASRRCGREVGYFEVELGEGARMGYEYLLKGELRVANVGRNREDAGEEL